MFVYCSLNTYNDFFYFSFSPFFFINAVIFLIFSCISLFVIHCFSCSIVSDPSLLYSTTIRLFLQSGHPRHQRGAGRHSGCGVRRPPQALCGHGRRGTGGLGGQGRVRGGLREHHIMTSQYTWPIPDHYHLHCNRKHHLCYSWMLCALTMLTKHAELHCFTYCNYGGL